MNILELKPDLVGCAIRKAITENNVDVRIELCKLANADCIEGDVTPQMIQYAIKNTNFNHIAFNFLWQKVR